MYVCVCGGEGRTHLQDDPRLELARPRLHLAARHQRLDGGRQAAPAELLKELARAGTEEEARQAEEVGPLLDALRAGKVEGALSTYREGRSTSREG